MISSFQVLFLKLKQLGGSNQLSHSSNNSNHSFSIFIEKLHPSPYPYFFFTFVKQLHFLFSSTFYIYQETLYSKHKFTNSWFITDPSSFFCKPNSITCKNAKPGYKICKIYSSSIWYCSFMQIIWWKEWCMVILSYFVHFVGMQCYVL